MRKKILVHCCCGPCATSSIQRLLDEGYEPVLCYGNSNIWPREENDLRYENLLKVADYFGSLEVVRQDYDHEAWLQFIKGLEDEPDASLRSLFSGSFQVEFETLQTALSVFRLVLQPPDETQPGFVVIVLPDYLKTSEVFGYFQQILIAQIVLLPGPDVAVPVAENRLVAFVQEPLDAACGTGSAAAVDKNLSAHGSILLYILKIDHTS